MCLKLLLYLLIWLKLECESKTKTPNEAESNNSQNSDQTEIFSDFEDDDPSLFNEEFLKVRQNIVL